MVITSKINRSNYFKEFPFYNKPIEKPRIKRRLTAINLLAELHFYKQLSVKKLSH